MLFLRLIYNLKGCGTLKEKNFTEKDWQLFKNKIASWQEAYIDRLNQEYIELFSKDADPSEKFWQLNKRMKKDVKKTGVQLEMKRSRLIVNLLSLINEGAIGFEDLEGFSEELKETIFAFIESD